MNITLMAHDKKKELMVQFCTAYKSILSKHSLSATAATGSQPTQRRHAARSGGEDRRLHGNGQVKPEPPIMHEKAYLSIFNQQFNDN